MTDYTGTNTLKKGTIGEQLCKKWLENEHGYAVFSTDTKCPHDIDLIATKKGEDYIFCEVKTKCAREHYPDTGFDRADYDHYVQCLFQLKRIPVFQFKSIPFFFK